MATAVATLRVKMECLQRDQVMDQLAFKGPVKEHLAFALGLELAVVAWMEALKVLSIAIGQVLLSSLGGASSLRAHLNHLSR